MPKQLTENQLIGDVLFEWIVPEYDKHERPRRWYMIMGTVAAVLILFGMFSGNFLFSLIIILAAIILFLQSQQEPLHVVFAITELGVIVGNRFYEYGELESFYIIYEPPDVKTMFIETDSIFRPRLRVPLVDMNPLDVQAVMRAYLLEDIEKEEPYSDRFARNWRIQ